MALSAAQLPISDLGFGGFHVDVSIGGLASVTWNGVEVLRAVTCLVRDKNWGTYRTETVEAEIVQGDQPRIVQRIEVAGGALGLSLQILAVSGNRIEMACEIAARRTIATNRAGLVLLHPIAGVAGTPLRVRHGDGSETVTRFPERISPAQPVLDIAGLSHRIGDVEVQIDLAGETFEMEDQRNWSDASYKTYSRPLALPYPYRVEAGEIVHQKMALTVARTRPDDPPSERKAKGRAAKAKSEPSFPMPEIQLAVEKDWLPSVKALSLISGLPPVGLLARLKGGQAAADIAAMARAWPAPDRFDLEVVLSDGDPAPELQALAAELRAGSALPRCVMALPEGWLRSVQPGQIPAGADQAHCAAAAARAFPGARIGVGALTNFTELNRNPPGPGLGDYVTHANTAIVHTADDASVWQTLEALPHVFDSARAIAGDRGYRLGLMSIAMRTNPYGAAMVANPRLERVAMAGEDPRQQMSFAAAYAIGVAAMAARFGAEAVALAAPVGRFGVVTPDGAGVYPVFHAVRALARLSGRTIRCPEGLAPGLAGLESTQGDLIVANCSSRTVRFEPAVHRVARHLSDRTPGVADADWLDKGQHIDGAHVDLLPGDCLFSTGARNHVE